MADRLLSVYPPLSIAPRLLRRRGAPAGFPYDRPGLVPTHLGRGAVWLALRALGLAGGARIAMPAYHCGSEVEAAHLAGCEIDFYRVDAALAVDEEDLARAAAGADATYLISHFGFPIAARPAGADVVIEDAAHALFSLDGDTPVGARGDAAIFCPRKSLGVPDGGAVLAPDGVEPSELRPPWRGVVRSTASLAIGRAAIARIAPVRRAATRVIAGASRGDAAAREGTLTDVVIGEWGLRPEDLDAAAARPARLTAALAPRADGAAIRARRRRNYAAIASALGEHVPERFRSLPEGTCPLYVPVLAHDRAATLARLLDEGVRGLEVWPVPHPLLDRERYAELEPLRAGLLALPVHQELSDAHVEAIGAAGRRTLDSV